MCRTVTTAAPDAERERQLRARYPGRWAEREREEGGEEDGGGEVQAVAVWLGNTHGAVEDDGDGNSHEWLFFVRVSDEDVVQEVQIELVSEREATAERARADTGAIGFDFPVADCCADCAAV